MHIHLYLQLQSYPVADVILMKDVALTLTTTGVVAAVSSIQIMGAPAILIGLGVGGAVIVGTAGLMILLHKKSKKWA